MIRGKRLWRAWFGPLLLGLAIVGSFLPACAGGGRLAVEVSEPFIVGGEEVPPGSLSVRHVSRLSPVASLDEVWVDGRCLGVLLASRSRTESRKTPESVVFTRDDRGRLVLAGYSLIRGGQTDLYRFATERPAETASAETASLLTARSP